MKRKKLPEVDWHVVLRGARQLLLFHDEEDYITFYDSMGKALVVSETRSLAHALLGNHLHMQLRGTTEQLTACMRRADRAYSGYHNKRYGLTGHAFEQSYYAEPIFSPFIQARVARYIHLNPVKAGLATRPEDYPWSNCRQYFEGGGDYLRSKPELVLNRFGTTPESAQNAYRAFVYESPRRRRGPKPVPKGPLASELWQEQFEWILTFVEDRQSKISPMDPLDVAIYMAVQAGIPPRAIGRYLDQPNGRRISKVAYRLSKALVFNPDWQAQLNDLGVL